MVNKTKAKNIEEKTQKIKKKSKLRGESGEELSFDQHIAKGHFLVKAIIEIMGAPKEHIEKTMEAVVDKVTEQDYLELSFEEIFEAKPAKDKETLFTTFTELEFWVASTNDMISFVFDFTPSSIEILEPTDIKISSKSLSDFLLDLIAKIHIADSHVKEAGTRLKLIDKNTVHLLRNFLLFLLKDEPAKVDLLSKKVGIKEENLLPFLDRLIEEGVVEKKDDLFHLTKK